MLVNMHVSEHDMLFSDEPTPNLTNLPLTLTITLTVIGKNPVGTELKRSFQSTRFVRHM